MNKIASALVIALSLVFASKIIGQTEFESEQMCL